MTRVSLIAASIVVLLTYGTSVAQEQQPASNQTTRPQAEGEKNQPKSEIDNALAELNKRGERIVTLCGDKCKDPQHEIKDAILNGHATDLVTPTYPAIARAAHASGQVLVLVIIDKDGNVMAAEAIDGHPLLRAAAVKAANHQNLLRR